MLIKTEKEKQYADMLELYKKRVLQLGIENQDYLKANKHSAQLFIQQLIKLGINTSVITSLNIFSDLDEDMTYLVHLFKIISENNDLNGGLITLKELQYHFSNFNMMISKDRLVTLMNTQFDKWKTGISLTYLEGDKSKSKSRYPIIRCYPMEISKDSEYILNYIKSKSEGFITKTEIIERLGWSTVRTKTALSDMVASGMLWIDICNNNADEINYWDYSSIYD